MPLNRDKNRNDDEANPGSHPAPLHPDRLTWAALLGQWIEFARSAVGLPEDDQGRLMRDSVADVIMLQAVWFAMQHMQGLSEAERSVGIDRAGVLIEKHEQALHQRWGQEMPISMAELITDAREALAHRISERNHSVNGNDELQQ